MLAGELAAWSPAAVVVADTTTLERTAGLLREQTSAPLLYGAGSSAAIAAFLEQGTVTAVVARNEFAAGYRRWRRWWTPFPKMALRRSRRCRFPWCARENMYEPEHQKLLFPVTR